MGEMMTSRQKLLFFILLAIIATTLVSCGGGPDNVIRDDSQPVPVLESDLATAENYFAKEDYSNAAVAYDNFIRKHPLNDNIDYALFREGLSYFNISQDPRRGQATTEKAARIFGWLIHDYPNSKYRFNAETYFGLCNDRLAHYYFNIAVFRFDQGQYSAAIIMFQYVLDNYAGFALDEDAHRYQEECKKRLSKEK
jgi:outer membrane protein assembly factor BamD